jgi:formamidopyrimidine-DNA glycosylase
LEQVSNHHLFWKKLTMPELPEVETIARYLRDGKDGPSLNGVAISAADVLWERTIAEPRLADFLQRIIGQAVVSIGRRAKFLVLQLTRDCLLVHLRMSGDLRLEPNADEHGQTRLPAAHDRVIFHLENGWRLVFNDPRKFGRVWLVEDAQSVLGGLGPEPLADDFSAARLYALLHPHNRQLKPLLLDQSVLAGLGNIYTDESLYLARLHPNQLASRLTPEDAARLWQAIRTVLEEGIRRNGASIDWVYRGGDFQNSFRVYQRTGMLCAVCGTVIERKLVGQRGTHFCPVCQPEPV